ncbi:MAG: hypothetical protein LC737_04695, partial [Chloroflexi bacterium]|nr:hypothetical protein [Chloroflexota bacterium]
MPRIDSASFTGKNCDEWKNTVPLAAGAAVVEPAALVAPGALVAAGALVAPGAGDAVPPHA